MSTPRQQAALETQIRVCHLRTFEAFLRSLSLLAPMRADHFGTLLNSTLPDPFGQRWITHLHAQGIITITRGGRPVDVDRDGSLPDDTVHYDPTASTAIPQDADRLCG